ncbi:MAG: amino acid permease [Candidatus Omnitrophica bacterium]|nr:amino acid permease [Candidatus Omnitrophota bacterium]
MRLEQLKRELRFWDSIAITVGIVIGVGIFRTPGEVAHYLQSPFLILSAWCVGGLISLLGVFCYAELASRHPETGGTYVFLREAYGKLVGFVYGWSEFSINRAASIAAVAYIFSAYLRNFIPFAPGEERWVAIFAIFFLTVVNAAGLRLGVGVQNFLSAFKILAILMIVGLIFGYSGKAGIQTASHVGSQGFNISHFAPALIPVLWSYGGWHESTFMSGEFQDTKRELPLAIIASALTVMALYVMINAAYLRVVPPAEMAGSEAIASDALGKIFGSQGQMIVSIAVLISALGALNSNILTGGRIPFAVAQDSPRLAWFGKVDGRFQTPLRSLALNCFWACTLVLLGNFEQLLFFTAFELWFFFTLVGISVFLLRRKNKLGDHFTVLGYPYVPILFTLVAASLCWTTIQHSPKESLFGASLILMGVPIYFLIGRGRYKSIV